MLFVRQKPGYQLKIYFHLLFRRLTDMANTMIVLSARYGDGQVRRWCR